MGIEKFDGPIEAKIASLNQILKGDAVAVGGPVLFAEMHDQPEIVGNYFLLEAELLRTGTFAEFKEKAFLLFGGEDRMVDSR